MKHQLPNFRKHTKSLFLWGLLVLLNLTLTQVFGQAGTKTTLPIQMYEGPWAVNNKLGFEMPNLGGDYTANLVNSTTGGSAKFDNSGDNIKISFNVPEGAIPGDLSYSINLANASSTASLNGAFDVEESVDGITYKALKTYSSDLRVVAGGVSFSHEMSPATRYVRFIYTTRQGSQFVQLDAIKLTAISGPEINVKKDDTDYLTGSTYPFSNQNINTASSAVNFTIQNKRGATDLILTNNPYITITGANAGEFTINQTNTTSPVAPNASTTFTVSFAPTTTGSKTAELIIGNNDSDEESYSIKLSGTGNILAPIITEVDPTLGPELSDVIIKGANLINTTEVRFNGKLAGFTINNDGQITATVPIGATTGVITVKNNNTTATGPEFEVVIQAAPVISSFNPIEGTVGKPVTIFGSNFKGANRVTFNGTPATVLVNLNGTEITTAVPENATTGPISVTTPGGTVSTNENHFIVQLIPIIKSISPNVGAIGEEVEITGENLFDVTEVSFNGTAATSFWEENGKVFAEVPAGATTGPITIKTKGGSSNNNVTFTVILVAPYISAIFPLRGEVGELITISGANFDDFTDISFNGVSAEVMWEEDGQLFAEVPAGATTGAIVVTTPGGTSNLSAEFIVIYPEPSITTINPSLGTVGQYVTITGKNFKYVKSVSFNGTQDINATADSETQITAQVPVGATTGPIIVTTLGGSALSTTFTVEVPNTTYTWNVTSGNWTNPNSWEPVRNTVTNADILIFDGSKISNPTINLDFASAQTIGQLQFKNGGVANLTAASDKTLNLDNGVAGPDFFIGSGTTVNFTNSATNAKVNVNITSGETGLVEGTLVFQGSGAAAHRLTAVDTDALIFQGIFKTTPTFTGSPFGTTNLNSVRFVANSIYEHDGGGSPFGAAAPNFVVLFDANSLYRQKANIAPDLNNRTYSNFEVNNSAFNQSVAGSGNLTLNNLTVVNSRDFDINLTGTITITGNITTTAGALSFTPAATNSIIMSGSNTKIISGNGNLSLGTNARLFVPAGVVVDLRKQIIGNGQVIVDGTIRTNVQSGFAAGGNTALKNSVTPILNAGSVIDYNGLGNQNISPISYANLIISGNRTTGSTISLMPGTIKVSEVFTNPATNVSYSADNNTVEFNGAAQLIPVLPYNNLTASGSAGKSVAGNIQANGAVNVNTTTITTGNHKITLNSAATLLESQTSYVLGKVEATRTVTAGIAENFGDLGLTLSPAAGSISPGTTTVIRSTGINRIQLTTTAQSITRTYDITAQTSSGLNTAMALKYAPNELSDTQVESNLHMYKNSGDGVWAEQAGTYTYNTVGKVISLAEVTGFSNWTLGEKTLLLPVQLLDFTATRRHQAVQLLWSTAMELNNKGFEIQVSTDAQNFKAVSFIASKNPNAKEVQKYSFLDTKTQPATILYYRLKQVDFNGTESYSEVKVVTFSGSPLTLEATAYPNPFADKFTVVVNADTQKLASITITDVMGRKIMEKTVSLNKGANDITFELGQQYSAGIYIINITTNNLKQHLRMVKK